MAKKRKKRQGHYCKFCGTFKPNEKFSGKGHAAHICKLCKGKTPKERQEAGDLHKLASLLHYRYPNVSKENRRMVETFRTDPREDVRQAAEAVLAVWEGATCLEEECLLALKAVLEIDEDASWFEVPF